MIRLRRATGAISDGGAARYRRIWF